MSWYLYTQTPVPSLKVASSPLNKSLKQQPHGRARLGLLAALVKLHAKEIVRVRSPVRLLLLRGLLARWKQGKHGLNKSRARRVPTLQTMGQMMMRCRSRVFRRCRLLTWVVTASSALCASEASTCGCFIRTWRSAWKRAGKAELMGGVVWRMAALVVMLMAHWGMGGGVVVVVASKFRQSWCFRCIVSSRLEGRFWTWDCLGMESWR